VEIVIPAFILLLTLSFGLSWVIIYLKGYWPLKALFITTAMYLTFSLFLSAENFKGWATSQTLPETFKIEWIIIQEPDKTNELPGAIYVWVSDIITEPVCYPVFLCLNDSRVKGPRAYTLKYSTEDHQGAMDLIERLEDGEGLVGEVTESDEEGSDGESDREFPLENIVIHDLPEFIENMKKDR
jgi:hypothetical protein